MVYWESFSVSDDACALGYSIFADGDDLEHLKDMIRHLALCHFDDGEAPQAIRAYWRQL